MSNITDGHKIEVSVIGASAVTVAAIVFDPSLAFTAVTAYFAFLGGLLMGKVL
jgi:hypothetical protein